MARKEPKTYTYLGASISQGYNDETAKGWVIRLFERLNADKPGSFYICNLAKSGERSYDLWHRLCGEALSRQSQGLFMEVFANDVNRPQKDDPHSVPAHVREELWTKIVNVAKKNYDSVILFSAFPKNEKVLYDLLACGDADRFTDNESISALNKQISEIAIQNKIPFIDLYPELLNDTFLDTLEDGVHPNGEGHQIIADLAYAELQKYL